MHRYFYFNIIFACLNLHQRVIRYYFLNHTFPYTVGVYNLEAFECSLFFSTTFISRGLFQRSLGCCLLAKELFITVVGSSSRMVLPPALPSPTALPHNHLSPPNSHPKPVTVAIHFSVIVSMFTFR